MSYEGFVQCICPIGHYYELDAYDTGNRVLCSECGVMPAWRNHVDCTNADAVGILPMPLMIKHFRISETPEVFRIPTVEETKSLQHYCDSSGNYQLLKSSR